MTTNSKHAADRTDQSTGSYRAATVEDEYGNVEGTSRLLSATSHTQNTTFDSSHTPHTQSHTPTDEQSGSTELEQAKREVERCGTKLAEAERSLDQLRSQSARDTEQARQLWKASESACQRAEERYFESVRETAIRSSRSEEDAAAREKAEEAWHEAQKSYLDAESAWWYARYQGGRGELLISPDVQQARREWEQATAKLNERQSQTTAFRKSSDRSGGMSGGHDGRRTHHTSCSRGNHYFVQTSADGRGAHVVYSSGNHDGDSLFPSSDSTRPSVQNFAHGRGARVAYSYSPAAHGDHFCDSLVSDADSTESGDDNSDGGDSRDQDASDDGWTSDCGPGHRGPQVRIGNTFIHTGGWGSDKPSVQMWSSTFGPNYEGVNIGNMASFH